MKNSKFALILSLLTLLVAVFLFFEYLLDLKKYHEEKISDFKNNYSKTVYNYEKILDYTFVNQLNEENLVDSIKNKDLLGIDSFVNKKFASILSKDFKYFDVYDENNNLIYSLNNKTSKEDKKQIYNVSFNPKTKSQGYFFTKSIQSYRFNFPIYKEHVLVGYINIGLDLKSLIKDLNINSYDNVDILLKKIHFKDITSFKYQDSQLSHSYYHLNTYSPLYSESNLKSINRRISEQMLHREDFIIDIFESDLLLNQLTFLQLEGKSSSDLGYLVYFSNDNAKIRLVVLQLVKFVLILLMISLLYSLYSKSEESSYFSKQLLDALYKVNIVSKTNLEGIITFVNDKFCETSGYKQDELIGQKHNIVRHEDMSKEYFQKLWNTIESKKIFSDVMKNKRKDGSAYYVNSTIIPILDTNENITEYLAIRNDVGNIINAHKQVAEDMKAFGNLCYIVVKIDQYDMYSSIYPTNFLLKLEQILLDKIITLKPEGLDISKTYNLLNGEYGFLFDRKDLGLNELMILIKKFLQNLNSYKITIDNYKYEFKFLISFTTENKYAIENQKLAMTAFETSKIKESIVCSDGFAKNSQDSAKKNLETIKMIEDALSTKNVVSYFQPIYNIKEEKIEKYESLVRIIKGDEVISPYFFMDIAKKSSLYKKITVQILENSFNILKDVKEDITINLSAIDIEDLDIRNILLGYFTTPEYYGRVTFEFLEDETIGDFELIKDFVGLSKIMGGVKLAIDDFGSGYSNYERVVDIKPDIIKIDGSLIKNIANNKSNQNIVKSIVQFAKSENIKTVAEFVADEETYNYVKLLDIDYAQGYFIGKPECLS